MTAAIDIMNYAPLVAPGLAGPEYQYEEFQLMLRTTFKRMAEGGTIKTLWGREVPLDGKVDIDPTLDVPGALTQLDAAGYDIAVLACLKMWSYRYHHKLIIDQPEEVVAKAIAEAPDRLVGGAGYNPFRIDESLVNLARRYPGLQRTVGVIAQQRALALGGQRGDRDEHPALEVEPGPGPHLAEHELIRPPADVWVKRGEQRLQLIRLGALRAAPPRRARRLGQFLGHIATSQSRPQTIDMPPLTDSV